MNKKRFLLYTAIVGVAASAQADDARLVHSGKGYRRIESPLHADAQSFVEAANIEKSHNDDGRQFFIGASVFGNMNFNRHEAAAYYLPGANQTLTVDAQPDYQVIADAVNAGSLKSMTINAAGRGDSNTSADLGLIDSALIPFKLNKVGNSTASKPNVPADNTIYVANAQSGAFFNDNTLSSVPQNIGVTNHSASTPTGINATAYIQSALLGNVNVPAGTSGYSADVWPKTPVTELPVPTNTAGNDGMLSILIAQGVPSDTTFGTNANQFLTNVRYVSETGHNSGLTLGIGDTTASTPLDEETVKGVVLRTTTSETDAVIDPSKDKIRMDRNQDTSVIRPWNFGIVNQSIAHWGDGQDGTTAFKSTLNPELIRNAYGAQLHMKYYFSDEQASLWADISTSAQRLKSYLKLNETLVTDVKSVDINTLNSQATVSETAQTYQQNSGFFQANSTAPINMTQAFDQKAFSYGKAGTEQTATKLADVQVKLGYQFEPNERYSSNLYVGAVIPTGNKAKAEYIAEPIVGNGGHVAAMLGASTHLVLHSDADLHIAYRSDTNIRYLFKNTQKRSFDIKGRGDWSRYMAVWQSYTDYVTNSTITNNSPTGTNANKAGGFNVTPGINIFTQDLHVTPGFVAHFNQAFHFSMNNWTAQVGWNTMVRQEERVKLAQAWQYSPVFVDCSGALNNYLNPKRTMFNDAYESTIVPNNAITGFTADEYALHVITENMLDLKKAASPACITHAPFVHFAYNWEGGCAGVGASYEFGMDNSYISQGTVWASLGLSF